MSKNHTKRVNAECRDVQEGQNEKLELLITGLIKRHQFLSEYRLQNLIYLAELLYLERTDGNSLSGASYTPYRYGSYSEEVRNTVESLSNEANIISEKTAYNNDTHIYRYIGSDPNHPEKIESLVNIVMSLSRHKCNYDLKEWVKSTYLFKNTDYDDEMELSAYIEQYVAKGSKPEWKKLI